MYILSRIVKSDDDFAAVAVVRVARNHRIFLFQRWASPPLSVRLSSEFR